MRTSPVYSCLLILALAWGCGDDEPSPDAGSAGSDAGTSASGSGASGSGTSGTLAADSGAEGDAGLGPTVLVRVVNLVPDVTFDMWGPDLDRKPVRLAEGLAYGTITDYTEVAYSEAFDSATLVLWKSGEQPEEGMLFGTLLTAPSTHERQAIELRVVDNPGDRVTLVVSPQDRTADSPLEWGIFDETDANDDATQANLHVAFELADWFGELPDGASPSFAVKGQPCLFDGSTNFQLAQMVAPGDFEVAVYDTQTGAECDSAPELVSAPIEAAAGESLVVVVYFDGTDYKILSAPVVK
jgi:hypothetical protein